MPIQQSKLIPGLTVSHESLCDDLCPIGQESGWDHCADANTCPFLQEQIFLAGSKFCGTGNANADAIYINQSNDVIALEVKDQPIDNLDDFSEKIRSCKDASCRNHKNFKMFVLQLSVRKNPDASALQLRSRAINILRAGKNNIRFTGHTITGIGVYPNITHENIVFEVIKCTDNDKFMKLI